jgi:transcription elongation factor GreA
MTSHDERHALLEELDLLRARQAELAESLAVDDPPHDAGEQSEMTLRRDELDWIDRMIRDITYLLHHAARYDEGPPDRVGVGSLVTLHHPDGRQETVKVTRVLDEDFPVVTPDSPLGCALVGATVGDEISWSTPEGRLRARVTDIQMSVGVQREGAGREGAGL